MKIELVSAPIVFEPRTLRITIDTQDELDSLQMFAQTNVAVPEAVQNARGGDKFKALHKAHVSHFQTQLLMVINK